MIARTIWVGGILLGVSIGFAMLLQALGRRIRCTGVGRWRRAYWYFVSPGVACHELGHCVGCWLTGARVTRVEFFSPDEDRGTLGYVRHTTSDGVWGALQSMVIATGPVWFGCLVIALLTKLLLGSAVVVRLEDYVGSAAAPGLVEYVAGCFRAGCGLFTGVLLDVVDSPVRAILWLYLSFCIASEIGMSSVDLSHTWRGLAGVVAVVLVLAMVPFVGKWIAAGVCLALPVVFVAHAFMAFGIVLSFALSLLCRIGRSVTKR